LRIREVWTTNLATLMFGFLMFGLFILIPTLVELPAQIGYGLGKSVTTAGLFLLPAVGAMLIFAPISGLIGHRFGPKVPFVLGALAATVGFAVTVFNHGATSSLMVCIVLNGAGLGLALAAMSNCIIEAVPSTHTGEAAGVNAIVRTVGGSIGAAVVAAVLSSNVTPQGLPLNRAFTEGFWVCAGVGVLAVAAALILPSAHRRHQDAVAVGVEDAPPEPGGDHSSSRSGTQHRGGMTWKLPPETRTFNPRVGGSDM
jgi:MFS family permease